MSHNADNLILSFALWLASPAAGRSVLVQESDKWFQRLLISTAFVSLGVILEAPESTRALWRWFCLKFGKQIADSDESSWVVPASYLGLLLVIAGVVGEGWFEASVSRADTKLRAFDSARTSQSEDEATDAGNRAVEAGKQAKQAYENAEKAQESTAIAEANASRANQAAAEANNKAEKERIARLELEEDIAPRIVEQGQSAERLRSFIGMRFAIRVVDGADIETRRTAGQLRALCQIGGWKEDVSLISLSRLPFPNEEGVEIEANGPNFMRHDAKISGGDSSQEASEVLDDVLAKSKIGYHIWPRGLKTTSPSLPSNTVIIHVGLKPLSTYFLSKRMKDGLTDAQGNIIYGNTTRP